MLVRRIVEAAGLWTGGVAAFASNTGYLNVLRRPASWYGPSFARCRRRASTPSFRVFSLGLSSSGEEAGSASTKEQQTRSGQAQQRLRQSVSRENRISVLEQIQTQSLSDAERAELAGLRTQRASFEEQYDPDSFSEEHKAFKASHNAAFVALVRYCEQERNKARDEVARANVFFLQEKKASARANVFFLDGPDGATSSALIQGGGGFEPNQCYSANRHRSTCDALSLKGGGILPPENVAHATAVEALTAAEGNGVVENHSNSNANTTTTTTTTTTTQGVGAFGNVAFTGFYFDGCGSFAPHVVDMLAAALLRGTVIPPLVIGFSLVGGNRDVVDKEVMIVQKISVLARRRGMRMVHVFDDPERYGVDPELRKIGGIGGGTMTTWLVLEAE